MRGDSVIRRFLAPILLVQLQKAFSLGPITTPS